MTGQMSTCCTPASRNARRVSAKADAGPPAASQDRWPAARRRPGKHPVALGRVEVPPERLAARPPQRAHGLHRFVETLPTLGEIDAGDLVVTRRRTRSHRDDGAAAR